MRRFYEGKRLTRSLTQGSIIDHCLADNYMGVDNIYGFIVTPRCDLAQNAKVTHVHYLPIVDFKDWVKQDGKEYLFNHWLLKKKEKFEEGCRKNQLPTDIFSFLDYEKMAQKTIVNKSDRDNFIALASIVTNPQSNSQDFVDYCNKKDTKMQLVKNLLEDKLAAFYLIENWKGNSGEYKVILLRELKRISISTAQKIFGGLYLTQIIDGKDELQKTSISEDLCKVCAQVASPFVEHIMQRFSHNFCRIGVDDRNIESEKEVLFKQL